ncbi:hypothetical protein [Spiroplasma endosymbiont of Polydrusus pterygomalis]|uniref:hypothetical protein n=1 Tax=Spiroplasma endosymbiont of Polydrusus pterygomalis TaxID=3139327 RepID=UPI003CCAFCB0
MGRNSYTDEFKSWIITCKCKYNSALIEYSLTIFSLNAKEWSLDPFILPLSI